MKDTVYFLNMFPDYEPPEALKSAVSQAVIVAADIDPADRTVEVAVHSPVYIPYRYLNQIIRDVEGMYGLKKLRILPTYPAAQRCAMEPEDLMALFVAENSMARGALAGAQWQWEDTCLHIHLKGNGKSLLEECLPTICRRLSECFGCTVTVQIHAGEKLEGTALYEAMEKMRTTAIADLPKANFADKKQPVQTQTSEAIYGKPFKGKPVPMQELSLDMGTVIVQGKVFKN